CASVQLPHNSDLLIGINYPVCMSQIVSPPSAYIHYPPGFRPRRALNWVILGAMYASYYMCRYNFRFATPFMEEEFGFDHTQITTILSAWSVAYGFGQLINGLVCDRIGGAGLEGCARAG